MYFLFFLPILIDGRIDEIMYSEVILRSHRAASAFLRTLQASGPKPPDFFAKCVKTLLIYSDIDTDRLVALLAICRGVVNLSYWPSSLGHATNSSVQAGHAKNGSGQLRLNTPTPWDSHTMAYLSNPSPRPPRPPPPPLLSLHQATQIHVLAVTQKKFDLHNISHIAPRSLSVQLHEEHPLFAFRPRFLGVPFFSCLTHLSIVNRWEEWTAWAGSRISMESLPRLTHLKFDLIVGQAPINQTDKRRSVSPSCSRWLETVTNSTCSSPTGSERTATNPAESAWTRKMTQVANALADVLNGHASLKVCVLVLRFDSNPAQTAKLISLHAAPKMLHWQSPNTTPSCSSSRDVMPAVSVLNMEKPENKMEVDVPPPVPGLVTADAPPPKFDPRLVYAWEKEVFRYNYAHSLHERMIWKSSEAVANAQRYLSGISFFLFDYLCGDISLTKILILFRVHDAEL